MPKLTVDGIEVEVPAGATVLQACEAAGKEIPRFCYHERLSIAGNCRMCLVEVSPGPPKPQASCALPAADGQIITTLSPKVKKAREGVMEFLLINHPLDCPICDQGGECDLQDQSIAYGRGETRFEDNKRAVTEKYMGPLIKTVMTRCIHCTRCVRFAEEVAGVEEIGAVFRGENIQITSYLEKAVTSELSGNVIDLCPVGALTSKPYAFEARPWELKKTEGIDVMDAVGSAIRIDARGNEVMRVLPRLNEDVNEEWISDKTRFACDGLKFRRLDKPYVRKGGKLTAVSWQEALSATADLLRAAGPRVGAIAGDLADVESLVALKDLLAAQGSSLTECRQDGAALDPSCRAGYVLNTTIAGLEQADLVLLVGTNPRQEAAVLNTRLRKAVRKRGAKVAVIGPSFDLTYPTEQLGDDLSILKAIASGAHPFAERLKAAQRPVLVLGMAALARPDGAAVLAAARAIADKCGLVKDGWSGFNVLHQAAARVGALDIGFATAGGVPAVLAGSDVLILHGADELDLAQLGAWKQAGKAIIYLGTHGDASVKLADVILPGAAFTEKSGTYVNTEGRVQRSPRAVFAPGDAREDWTILRALSGVLGVPLPYDDLAALRRRIAGTWPHLGREGLEPAAWGAFGQAGDIAPGPVALGLIDYYQTNPVARASRTMGDCSAIITRGEDDPALAETAA
jgi:NADH-quinone oxidoreductase subunit G